MLKVVLSYPGDMILQDEVEGTNKLSEADLVFIQEAKVSGLVQFDGINLHVGGLDE